MCKTPGIDMVISSTFIPCQFKITYIWLCDNTGVWAKPIKLSDKVINCWIWNGAIWLLADVPLLEIEAFICN